MRALAHPDLFVLEATLGDLVGQAQEADPLARVAVIVPTARLAAHVERRLAERFGALLGVEVLHHRALAYRILDDAGLVPPRVLSTRLLADLLRATLRERDRGELARLVAASPGSIVALLGTLTDLREAGVTPDEALPILAATPRGQEIAGVYARFAGRVDRLAADGLTDGAGLVLAALPYAAPFAESYRAIVHHGAYDLIGVHADLLRAIDAGSDLTALLPCEPPVAAWPGAERLPDAAGRQGLLGTRLAHLHDESWSGEPLPAGGCRFAHAQGNAAELRFALHAALARVGAGTPPHEIGIVARSLAPWSNAVPGAADDLDLRLETSLTRPAASAPEVRELCHLLRTVADGFPRAATIELLASERLRWHRLPESRPPLPPPDAPLADRLSRRRGLIGGLDEWTEALEAGDSSAAGPARLGAALRALAEAVRPDVPRSWAEHAAAFAGLAAALLEPATSSTNEAGGLRPVDALLGEMRLLPRVMDETGPIPFERAVAWLEETAASTPLPSAAEDVGALRVLDAMQARGLTFDTLLLIGMNDGAFPRPVREDPLLPDATRRALRQATGRAVPVRSDGEVEERLLLSMLLGSAARRIEVSWQRADDAGRERAPSLALRAVARLARGQPDLGALRRAALRVAAHPAQRLEETSSSLGLLSPRDAVLLAALRQGPEALARQRQDLAAGIALLRATDSFAPGDGRYDGRVAPLPAGTALAVATLGTAGQCALQSFFRHRLHLAELDEEAAPEIIPARDLGNLVHTALQRLFERLGQERLLAPGASDAATCLARAEALLPEIWEALVRERFAPRSRRLPTLWTHELGRWQTAVIRFLREDLPRLFERGSLDIQCEVKVETPIALPGSEPLLVRGRFDRLSAAPDRTWIADYKTGGGRDSLASMTDVTAMLRGEALQVPLYHLLARESAAVELLLVRPQDEEDTASARFERFPTPGHREEFLDTLRVIADLLRAGRHPIRPEEQRCRRCAWRPACRRTHPPTLERESNAPDTVDYRRLGRKSRSGT